MAKSTPNRAPTENAGNAADIPAQSGPGSASQAHPLDGIPLPAHGFETLEMPPRELAAIPAGGVVIRCAAVLMSTAADKLGLTPGEEPDIDLPEARTLIEALAGLLAATLPALGEDGAPLREGLQTLQRGFREASAHPDPEGRGPGEHLLS